MSPIAAVVAAWDSFEGAGVEGGGFMVMFKKSDVRPKKLLCTTGPHLFEG